MKKLSYIILGFIIGAVITYYFSPGNPGVDPSEATSELAEKGFKPKNLISIEDAKKLNNNWSKYRCTAVDSCIRVQTGGEKDHDNRWAEWSVKEIRQYLAYARYESRKMGYKMTGLRFYLGVYPDENEPEDKKLTTTMFMVPRGHKRGDQKASMIPFNFVVDTDIPIPPGNNGGGGTGGYPN